MVLPFPVTIQVRGADRGLYLLEGTVNYFAPVLQVLYTPNGTPINVAAVQADSFPRSWKIKEVLENAPADAPAWSETETRLKAEGKDPSALTTVPAEDNKSVVQIFTEGVASDVKKSLNTVGDVVKYVVLAVIVILILIILIQRS